MSEYHNHSNDDECKSHCPICDHPLPPGIEWIDCPNCEVEWQVAPEFEVADLDEPGDDVSNLPTAIGIAAGLTFL